MKKKNQQENTAKKQGNEGNKLVPTSNTSPSKMAKPAQISK